MALALSLSGVAGGDLVTFENTNPSMETMTYFLAGNGYSELGLALDVTQSAFEQPGLGELPVGSFMFTWFEASDDVGGDWIYIGQGRNTQVSQGAELIEVIDPYTFHPVGHPGPGDLDDGQEIGESTLWAPSWVVTHAVNSQTPSEGVFFTDESFTLGLRFVMDDGVHFGFAEMTRTGFTEGEPLSIGYRPVRWGYETTAGVSVPGVGTLWVGALGIGFGMKRRR